MSMRFKKSIKLSKNTKINFSKKSISFTAGTKHIHHTVSSNGSKTNSVGIPGTGISFVDRSSGNNHKTSKNSFNVSANNNYSEIRDVNKMSKYTDKQLKNNIIIFSIIAAVLALISIFNMPLGILLIVIALVLLIPIIKYGIELNIRKTTGNEYLTLEKETKNPYQE